MLVHAPFPVSRRGRRCGFTLLETAIAQVIVAFAVVATCQLLATGTAANLAATEMTTAIRLTHPIHELAKGLNGRELQQLDGKVFSPPVNADLSPLQDQAGWQQRVSLSCADESQRGKSVAPMARLHVEIRHQGHFVYETSWLLMMPRNGGAQ